METLGSAVGDHVGNGQRESLTQQLTSIDFDIVDAELGFKDSSDSAHPLLIFYDCETTGLSVYNEHITDVAAKVVASPVPLETPTFSSLVATSRRIPEVGTSTLYHVYSNNYHLFRELPRSQVSPPQCSRVRNLSQQSSPSLLTGLLQPQRVLVM